MVASKAVLYVSTWLCCNSLWAIPIPAPYEVHRLGPSNITGDPAYHVFLNRIFVSVAFSCVFWYTAGCCCCLRYWSISCLGRSFRVLYCFLDCRYSVHRYTALYALSINDSCVWMTLCYPLRSTHTFCELFALLLIYMFSRITVDGNAACGPSNWKASCTRVCGSQWTFFVSVLYIYFLCPCHASFYCCLDELHALKLSLIFMSRLSVIRQSCRISG